jgi:heptosyltransferase-2
MQRLLVIRGGAIGDTIVTLPALGALRQAFPRATITLLGNPQRAILAQHPRYVNHIIDLERWDMYRLFSQHATLSEATTAFLSAFDLILSYLPTPDETLASNLRRYCQGEVLTWPPHPPARVHITDHLLHPVTRFLHQSYDRCPCILPDLAAHQAADHFWQAAGLPAQGVIAFHPGSGGAVKLWPLAGWHQVITWAARQGIPGLLISGPAEQDCDAQFWHAANLPPWPRAHNLPLPHLAAMLARCQMFVGHDAGVTHLAAAVGTTTVALFGPTDPFVWGPRSAQACVLWPQPSGPLTLVNLTPDMVLQTLAGLLHGTFTYAPSVVDCTILDPTAPGGARNV